MELVGGYDTIIDDAFAAYSRRLLKRIKRKHRERPKAVIKSFWESVIVIEEQADFYDPVTLEAA